MLRLTGQSLLSAPVFAKGRQIPDRRQERGTAIAIDPPSQNAPPGEGSQPENASASRCDPAGCSHARTPVIWYRYNAATELWEGIARDRDTPPDPPS